MRDNEAVSTIESFLIAIMVFLFIATVTVLLRG